jgi:hypothetical protein
MRGDESSSRSESSPLIRPKHRMGLSHTKAGGMSPENMNLLVNEPTRHPGQPLCQDPWTPGHDL